MPYTVTLSAAEEKALSYAAVSPQEWVDNFTKDRARIAGDEIVKIAVDKFLERGEQIPATREAIIEAAFTKGFVKSASERAKEALANVPKPPSNPL